MISVFKNYEREVLALLAAGHLSPEQIDAVVREGTFIHYEYSGCGYFLAVAHPCLPAQRTVCDRPIVTGHVGGIDSGFVIFIEDGLLTLECHSWGATEVPEGFREMDVQVGTRHDNDKSAQT